MVVRGWTLTNKTENPDKQTPLISDNYFTMAPNTTSGTGMLPVTFNSDFSTTKIRRLQIATDATQPVPDKVYDDSTVVKGIAQPGSTITILIKRTNVVKSAVTNPDGTFSIPVDADQLQASDIIEFSSTLNNTTSPVVTRTVIGTVLELVTPADIIFKTTAIKSSPDLIINRETPVDYIVKVKDTKTSGSWSVSVQATKQLTSTKGDVLDDALVYKQGTSISTLKSAVKVTDKSKAVSTTAGEYDTKWDSTDGILLRTNPAKAAADTYTGTLTWTLTSGP